MWNKTVSVVKIIDICVSYNLHTFVILHQMSRWLAKSTFPQPSNIVHLHLENPMVSLHYPKPRPTTTIPFCSTRCWARVCVTDHLVGETYGNGNGNAHRTHCKLCTFKDCTIISVDGYFRPFVACVVGYCECVGEWRRRRLGGSRNRKSFAGRIHPSNGCSVGLGWQVVYAFITLPCVDIVWLSFSVIHRMHIGRLGVLMYLCTVWLTENKKIFRLRLMVCFVHFLKHTIAISANYWIHFQPSRNNNRKIEIEM